MASSVYTKTGDKGMTSLFTEERVSKCSDRVEAYGSIDELQAFLGLARAHSEKQVIQDELLAIETELWLLMADVASLNQAAKITEDSVLRLEETIDKFDASLAPLDKFICPGDKQSSSYLHVARTVARRAERQMWRVLENEAVHESNLRYLNRLSDLCFIMSRVEEEV
ncbi:MAG: cob(I)yrinic acid a,c-diamide adenosyltransferase [Negativicutes bacterium]|nr:cob(I)yrinic acid a,c-diamide adenosyltransferase [Negativicutes bacterium]